MSAQIVQFPTPRQDRGLATAHRAAKQHMLVAMANYNDLTNDDGCSEQYARWVSSLAALEGLALLLRTIRPEISNEAIDAHLTTALAFYRAQQLGVTG